MSAQRPEDWERVRSILEAALVEPPDRRAAFVEASCRDEPSIREQVIALLASHNRAAAFLETPAGALLDTHSRADLTGAQIGPYHLGSRIGRGGMGDVYRARDTRLDRTVAVKVLPATIPADQPARDRFEREARAVAALNHPHIGVALDDDGNSYVAGRFSGEQRSRRYRPSRASAGTTSSWPSSIRPAVQSGRDRRARRSTTSDGLSPSTVGSMCSWPLQTASSGLAVSFAASGPCSVSGNVVTLTGTGTCSITTSQSGDANFLPANDVVRSFLISPGTPPVIIIGNAIKAEGHVGTSAFSFNVTLSHPSLQLVTVHSATSEGSATAGVDYLAANETLTFNPGETSQAVTVQVNGDTTPEPDETFAVALDTPTNATVSGSQGVGTGLIFNDDSSQIESSGTAARALLLQTGSLFPSVNIDGRYGGNSFAPVSTGGVGTSGATGRLTASQPSVGATAMTAQSGASGTGAARAIGYYQYRNTRASRSRFRRMRISADRLPAVAVTPPARFMFWILPSFRTRLAPAGRRCGSSCWVTTHLAISRRPTRQRSR
jgi:hypothetical protein